MKATSRTVRFLAAALAVLAGSMLLLAKSHYNDELARLTTKYDAYVLPVAEVIGQRPAPHLAAVPGTSRTN